jgi:predicted membrane protein
MKISPRVVVGLLIVAFGLALTLDELGVMNAGELIHYWPFGIVAVGVANVLDKDRSKRTLGWIMVGVGSLLVVENFFRININVWRFWPLAIVVFGLLIVYRSMRPRPEGVEGPGYVIAGGNSALNAPGNKAGTMQQVISDFVMWSGIQRRVASPAFKRADLTAIMGGIELDLRQAGTENGQAVIDVFVLWGGIEITVPPDWAVSNEITPIMGGAEDGSTGTQQAKHRLVVTGVVIMGGVDIKV